MIDNGQIKLFPFQEETILEIEDFRGRALIALEMGLGKTLISLKWLKKHPQYLPALIVCPANVKFNWRHEAYNYVRLQSSVCEGQKPPTFNQHDFSTQSPLTIINYDILTYWIDYLKKLDLKTIVFDESQYLQNPQSKRTKAAKSLSGKFKQVLALSGTPLTNKPSELWPTLNILWPESYNSFWSYAQDFCNPRYIFGRWDFSGSSNLPELHRQLKLKGMIRRRKVDVLKELPEKVRRIIPCELSDPKEYQEASTDFISWIRKNKGHKIRSTLKAEKLVMVGELLRLVAKLKMRAVVDWANKFLEETDEKLILFAFHKKAIKVLKNRVNAKNVVIDGSVTGRNRELAVRQFQNDPNTRLFIGNIKAAGIGITLTAASTIGFAEIYWVPGSHIQAEDRPHRIGQKNTVWINYLIAGNTIEEDLCKILQKKQKVISAVLDGGSNPQDLNLYKELLKVIERKI